MEKDIQKVIKELKASYDRLNELNKSDRTKIDENQSKIDSLTEENKNLKDLIKQREIDMSTIQSKISEAENFKKSLEDVAHLVEEKPLEVETSDVKDEKVVPEEPVITDDATEEINVEKINDEVPGVDTQNNGIFNPIVPDESNSIKVDDAVSEPQVTVPNVDITIDNNTETPNYGIDDLVRETENDNIDFPFRNTNNTYGTTEEAKPAEEVNALDAINGPVIEPDLNNLINVQNPTLTNPIASENQDVVAPNLESAPAFDLNTMYNSNQQILK